MQSTVATAADESVRTEHMPIESRRICAQRILKAAQEAAFRNGTSKMTLEEINAEIAATRAERKAREKTG